MTSEEARLDDKCGLDGHGQHNWSRLALSSSGNYVFRTCSFCGRQEETKTKWSVLKP